MTSEPYPMVVAVINDPQVVIWSEYNDLYLVE